MRHSRLATHTTLPSRSAGLKPRNSWPPPRLKNWPPPPTPPTPYTRPPRPPSTPRPAPGHRPPPPPRHAPPPAQPSRHPLALRPLAERLEKPRLPAADGQAALAGHVHGQARLRVPVRRQVVQVVVDAQG